jgi:hypothetical protein
MLMAMLMAMLMVLACPHYDVGCFRSLFDPVLVEADGTATTIIDYPHPAIYPHPTISIVYPHPTLSVNC